MKVFIILSIFLGVALAAPVDDKETQVLRSESEVGVSGYKFAYETSDGVERQEEAELKNIAPESDALVVRGSIKWVAPDGETYQLNFVADENGYQPEAEHIPKA